MKKNYGRKLRRRNKRIKSRADRAYLEGTKFEDEGIKKTKRYADNRQKIGKGLIHRAEYKSFHQIKAGRK